MAKTNNQAMASKASASAIYTISSATKSNAIDATSYENAVKAADIFNQYLKLNDNFNADTEFKVVKVVDEAIIDAADAVVKTIDEITLNGGTFCGHSFMEFDVNDVTFKNWRMGDVRKKHNLNTNDVDEYNKFINDVIDYMGGANAIEKMLAEKKSAVAQAEIDRLSKYVINATDEAINKVAIAMAESMQPDILGENDIALICPDYTDDEIEWMDEVMNELGYSGLDYDKIWERYDYWYNEMIAEMREDGAINDAV